MGQVRVKICCIKNQMEAQSAIEFGASAVGLVADMPSGPGIISDEQIALIAQGIPPGIDSFLLTSNTQIPQIVKHHQATKTTTIQLVDKLQNGTYEELRKELFGVKIVQVIHVLGDESIEEALKAAENADMLLLDSGNPNLATKILGGTGKTHNWDISKKICEQSKIPVFLAGGISADNVKRAIDIAQPYGLDLCSGVRTNDVLDMYKLEAFFDALR